MHFTLADLVTDITQNAVEAGACEVELDVEISDKEYRFLVKDNGKGMTEEELKRALDPFVTDGIKHPHRKVGLGLPFLIQTAEQSGGGWDVKSEKGKGTTVTAWFDTGNVDTPPAGDIPGMFRTILMFDSSAEIIIRRKSQGGEYEIRKSELSEAIGGFEDVDSLVMLKEYLNSLEE
ncbi:MAG: sensor histidine kinase [Treponema sp.]|nr:sensor histidine kinase [Treponema sp.]